MLNDVKLPHSNRINFDENFFYLLISPLFTNLQNLDNPAVAKL